VNVDTSRDATIHADLTGLTAKAQKYALILAGQRGTHGVTVAELRELHGSLHHGRISAALTNLHKAGRLVALRERRNHCGIYVLPEYVEGREARPFRSNRPVIDRSELRNLLDHHRMIGDGVGHWRCYCLAWEGLGLQSFRDHLADVIIQEFGR